MTKLTRTTAVLAVTVLTLISAGVGAYWSWIALPRMVDPSLRAAWNRMGGVNPLLLVVTAFLALSAIALFTVAVSRVVRDRASGWTHLWGAYAWGCLSGFGAAVASTFPGLAVIVYVDRVLPGFMDGIVPGDFVAVNGIRLVLGPVLIAAGVLCVIGRVASQRQAVASLDTRESARGDTRMSA